MSKFIKEELFYVWKKHMNQETHEVETKSMSFKGLTWMLAVTAVATVAYGTFLKLIGGISFLC